MVKSNKNKKNKNQKRSKAKAPPKEKSFTISESSTIIHELPLGLYEISLNLNAANFLICSDTFRQMALQYEKYKLFKVKFEIWSNLKIGTATSSTSSMAAGFSRVYDGTEFLGEEDISRMQINKVGNIDEHLHLNCGSSPMMSSAGTEGLATSMGTVALAFTTDAAEPCKLHVKISATMTVYGDPLSVKYLADKSTYEALSTATPTDSNGAGLQFIADPFSDIQYEDGALPIKISTQYNQDLADYGYIDMTDYNTNVITFGETGTYDVTLYSDPDDGQVFWDDNNEIFTGCEYTSSDPTNSARNGVVNKKIEVTEEGATWQMSAITVVQTIGAVIAVGVEIAKVVIPLALEVGEAIAIAILVTEPLTKKQQRNKALVKRVAFMKRAHSRAKRIRDASPPTELTVRPPRFAVQTPLVDDLLHYVYGTEVVSEVGSPTQMIEFASRFLGGVLYWNFFEFVFGGSPAAGQLLGDTPTVTYGSDQISLSSILDFRVVGFPDGMWLLHAHTDISTTPTAADITNELILLSANATDALYLYGRFGGTSLTFPCSNSPGAGSYVRFYSVWNPDLTPPVPSYKKE